MPDTELSLFRDGSGFSNYYSTGNRIPTFYYNEVNPFKIILSNQYGYTYAAAGPITFSLSIGQTNQSAKRGEWAIGNGSVTGTAVSYNATSAQLVNALSAAFGAVRVTTYGNSTDDGYIITAATAGTALTLIPKTLSLSPACTFDVMEITAPSTGVTAQKLVRLRRLPAIQKTQYLNVTCFDGTSITASGPSSVCGPWYVTIPTDAQKYPEMLRFYVSVTGSLAQTESFSNFVYSNTNRSTLVDNNSVTGLVSRTISNAIMYTTSTYAATYLPVFRSGGSANGITLYGGTFGDFVRIQTQEWGSSGLKITASPVTSGFITAVTLSGGGAPQYLAVLGGYDLGAVTFSGQALDEEFIEARSDTVSLILEINIEESGFKTTVLQTQSIVRRSVG